MSFEKCWIGGKNTRNIKVELCSEVILYKTILDLMQYSLSKDHQHLKWQPPRSWILSPDCLVAMDKQQTQYQLFAQFKKEDAHKLLKKFPNRNVRTFGFADHDTNGQNHGPVWKTQSFFWKGIWMVGHLLVGLLWERQFEKILLKQGWRKFQIGNVSLYAVKKDYSDLCMWMT